MNVKLAAQRTYRCALAMDPRLHRAALPKATLRHLRYMHGRIQRGEVTGTKAHRWLGWMQAVVYLHEGATHEHLQQVNKDS